MSIDWFSFFLGGVLVPTITLLALMIGAKLYFFIKGWP